MKAPQRDALIDTLKTRFEKHMPRHKGIKWSDVLARLQKASPEQLKSLHEMEESGGEPDVIGRDEKSGAVVFCDCSAETPKGRRSVCYDREGLESRKDHPPKTSAIDMANEMGITMLTEEQYRHLQTLGEFDTKTSSWVLVPPDIRKLDGGIFCDRRYGRVFTYHNGPQSYYAVRGFRGSLSI